MALSPGDRLGSFEVLSLVGEGGMGRVYRARDTKLGRDVAIKVLPDAFARDAERLARFRREAQALAALNDPHIAHIYHLEEIGQSAALVMEFVEGQTIADAIQLHALDRQEAIRLAGEIAAGLETAHEKGIIHRDLKPANVKITPDGHAKILDFGLAKAMAGDSSSSEMMNSPTLTARATEAGVVLGTAAYMSPEQARAKSVDKRTDIWAFGAVLFEMLTGQRAFGGDTVSDTLASILRSDPEWSLLPADVPPHVRALLARCLERDVTRRLRDIGEARLALSPGASATSTIVSPAMTASGPVGVAPVQPRRPWLWMLSTAMLAVALAALIPTSSLVKRAPAAAGSDSFELAISAPPDAEFQIGSNSGNVVLSPDGTRLAFVATATAKASTIWLRSLAVDDAKPLPGTEGASNLFWSPDGRRIGFFADAKLKKVSIAGGMPETLAEAPGGRGGSWSEDDTIIFTPNGGSPMSRVSASGGTVTSLTKLDTSRGENAHYWPQFLPGGKNYLYFVRTAPVENGGIYLGHMDGSPAVRLVPSLSSGFLAKRPSTGQWYLLWVRDGDLLAQPFDVASGKLSGDPQTVTSGVRVEESQRLSYASASLNGRLAWAVSRAADVVFAVIGRDGHRIRTLDVPAAQLIQPTISPDGTRVAFGVVDRGSAAIYVHNLSTGVTERLTDDLDYNELPAWTRDSRAIVYKHGTAGRSALIWTDLARTFHKTFEDDPKGSGVGLVTLDQRYLITTRSNSKTGVDLFAQSLKDDRGPLPLLTNPGDDSAFGLSVDGKWLFILTAAGARSTLSVARLHTDGAAPVLGPLQTIGENGVVATARPDGSEVYLLTADGTVSAIPLTATGDTITRGASSPLFRLTSGSAEFSVNPKGTEFVVTEMPYTKGQTLRVLTNWEARLK